MGGSPCKIRQCSRRSRPGRRRRSRGSRCSTSLSSRQAVLHRGAGVARRRRRQGGGINRGEPGRWGSSERADADLTYFIYYNLNKRSVTCNLKSEEGKALLRRMIEKADVVIENMAPGNPRAWLRLAAPARAQPAADLRPGEGLRAGEPARQLPVVRHDRPGDGRHDGRERPS